MAKTYLNVERFDYIGNIINLLSVGYRFTAEKSYSYLIQDQVPAKLRITTGETKTGVNTSVDFSIQPSFRVAVLKQNFETLYNKMAVAWDRTTKTLSKCVGWDGTNLTFNALSGGGVHDVDIFYLLGEGNIRVQIANPGGNVIASTALFEGGIEDINIKDQGNYEDYLYMAEAVALTDAMKLELAFNTRAPIYLKSKDLNPDIPYNVAPSLVYIPVEAKRTNQVAGIENAKKQLNV